MARGLSIAILVLFLSCFAGAKVALARTLAPGVSEGDAFYYQMYGVYTSDNPNAAIEVPAFEANNTEWVRIEITGVSSSIIYHIYILHFKNGTEQVIGGQTDLTRSLNFSSGFAGVPICAANLNVGDKVSTVQLTVNKTLMRSYPSGKRETNYVSWNMSEDWGYCYFDKKTGMLVDLYRVHSFVNSTTHEVIKKADVVKMTNSSLWVVPEFPTFLFPLLLIIGVTIGASFYRIKEKLTERVC